MTPSRALGANLGLRQRGRAQATSAWIGAGLLLLLSACEGVQLGGDALSMNLTPRQAQVCRDAVRDALAGKNVTEAWIRRVHYQAIQSSSRTGSRRLQGFEAWVYPKEGRGAIIVELSNTCQVTRVWARGMR